MSASMGSYVKIKRVLDIIVALLGLIIFSPLFLIIASLVKVTSPGPVLFKQERIGLAGRPFMIFKFRTFVAQAEQAGRLITVQGDYRITRVGHFLRRLKLDELPQLYNVLKGEMSLVGPRPEVRKYVDMYNQHQLQVLRVRPGITDYASILFRKEQELLAGSDNPEEFYIRVIMPQKLKLNLTYIKEMSFQRDWELIFITIKKLYLSKTKSIGHKVPR